tara:strand:+ start:4640 stop:5440 length:801 start_codon:yes stop_codon:yes gene_type:complete
MLGLGVSLSTGGAPSILIPSDISGLDLWLQVNKGIVGADGGASADGDMADGEDINSWADQSGNDRHASQETASRKPHWETTAADFGGVRWTEADNDPHMNLASNVSISANQDFTIMVRVKIEDFFAADGSTDEARSLVGSAASSVLKITSNKRIATLIGGSGASAWEESSDAWTTSDYYIFTLTRSNGSTGNLELRVHGGTYSDKSWDSSETHTDADAFVINNIGSAADSAIPMEGVFKDVLIWKGTALSDSQRTDMYSYLNGQEY